MKAFSRLLAALLLAPLAARAADISKPVQPAGVTLGVTLGPPALAPIPAMPASAASVPSAVAAIPGAALPSALPSALPAAPKVAVPAGPAAAPAAIPSGPAAANAAEPRRAPSSALETSRRVAAAAQDQASPVSVSDLSARVFDGASRAGAAAAVQAPSKSAPAARGARPLSDDTSGLSGAALLRALHDKTGRGYRAHDYDEAHKYLFGTADQVVVNGKRGVVDAYSGVFVPGTSDDGGQYVEHGDQNHDGRVDDKGMNVEHVWPQSFFSKALPMRSDLHHLMATFIWPNGVRGNLPFGEVRGRGDYSNDAGARRGQGVFEPPDAVKGRVARALLYFYTRYNDRNISNGAFGDDFWNTKLDMILRWNRQFPPTDWERSRNDAVEKFQGNRNPFVDDPGLADRIGADALRRVPALQFHERQRIIRRRR